MTSTQNKNRFVVQKHTKDGKSHWDLMLELPDCDKLATWRIDTSPENWNVGQIKADKIFDHNKKYLTYQGLLNNNKGQVEIADSGTFKIISETKTQIEIELSGTLIKHLTYWLST